MRGTEARLDSAADGRFQSLIRIGGGGMGIVYGATDTWTQRRVALNLLLLRPHDQRGPYLRGHGTAGG